MTESQRQVFWDHFRHLDSERQHFYKPPTNWAPKAVRDMNPEELHAYWGAFQVIMNGAVEKMPDQLEAETLSEPEEMETAEASPELGTDSTALAIQQEDVSDPGSSDDANQPLHDSDQKDNSKLSSSSSALVKSAMPAVRLRGKTSAAQVEQLTLAKIQSMRPKPKSKEEKRLARRSTKHRSQPGGSPPKKRKYSQSEGVERTGKKSCVTIWTKVQLFKDTWL